VNVIWHQNIAPYKPAISYRGPRPSFFENFVDLLRGQ
jgi:hypothetical protein